MADRIGEQRMRRWRKVVCDECGASGLELMTLAERTAYLGNEWVWLCENCFCEGDDEE